MVILLKSVFYQKIAIYKHTVSGIWGQSRAQSVTFSLDFRHFNNL